ncbi:MAG: ATP-binding protein [Bacteroidia bacterium]
MQTPCVAQDTSTYDSLLRQGDDFIVDRQMDSAAIAYKQLLAQVTDACWRSIANRRLADHAQKINLLDSAIILATVSLEQARRCSDSIQLSSSLNQLGGVYFRQNAYGTALQYFLEASVINKRFFDQTNTAQTIFYLGQIYLNQTKYPEAIKTFKEGLSQLDPEKSPREISNMLSILIRAYGQAYQGSSVDSLQQGISYYEQALDQPFVTKNRALSSAIRIFLAEYYQEIIGSDSCLSAIRFAQQNLKPNSRNLAYALVVESKLWLDKEQAPKAIAAARKATEISKNLGSSNTERSAYSSLHEALAQTNDYFGAYEALLRYKELEDTILTTRLQNQVFDLDLQYKNQKLAQEQERLSFENNLFKTRSRLGGMVSILLGSLLALGIWFFIRLQNKNKLILAQSEALQRANKSKNQLFAIIAHDLRGPFISFQGLTKKLQYLQKQERHDDLAKVTTHIEQTSRHLNGLLDNLLAWAIEQREDEGYEAMRVNVSEAISGQHTDFEPVLDSKEISLHVEMEPQAHAWVSPPVLATILRNLISNAVKFSPEGSKITIQQFNEDNKLYIRVSDEGPGISPEIQEMLFSLLPGTSKPGSAGEKGIGLGLSLCKELALASGGDLLLDKHYLQGASFILSLPLPTATS